jgi:methionyl-tRNA formyltransferase
MFDTIILLTEPAEQDALALLLRRHNPQLTIRAVTSLPQFDTLEPDLFARARLIGFSTPVVVPRRIIDALGFGAYNFHPGPPHYPGWMPSHFAIHDHAAKFGATLHVMTEQIDAGPIVGVELFGIPPNASVQSLEEMAYRQLAQLFWKFANPLANQCEPLPELAIRWSGRKSTRRIYAAMCDIPFDISNDDLDRRIEAFGGGQFGMSPTITLHGRKFRYIEPDADIKIDALDVVAEDQHMMKRAG